jgi:hypothetical protein
MPYGYGQCQDGTLCVSEDQAGAYRYCMYKCAQPSDCPAGSSCLPLTMGGNVCAINTNPMAPAVGKPCMNGLCATAAVCDNGNCVAECNGPSDATTCTGGTKCVPQTDPSNGKIADYECK